MNHTTKLKISKKHQEDINKLRALIESHRIEEDKLIETMTSSMNLSKEHEAILWDYIYNDSYWMVELEK